jgi:hypothetical protein
MVSWRISHSVLNYDLTVQKGFESMKIKMAFQSESGHRTETKDIPLPIVADRLLKLWLTKKEWWSQTVKGYHMPSTGSVYGVLATPPDEKDPLNYKFFSCQPIFRLHEVENWLAIKWLYSEVNLSGPIKEGWFFFHYEIGTGYRLVDIPRCCKIDPVTGDITVTSNANSVPVKAFTPSWPSPLLEDRYLAIGLLDKMMQPREESPLSILVKSAQPYSGLAKQVLEDLQKVKGCLTPKYF